MAKKLFAPVADPDAAMRRFNTALGVVLSVSKDKLDRGLAKEKASRQGKPKPGPKSKRCSGHAVSTSV